MLIFRDTQTLHHNIYIIVMLIRTKCVSCNVEDTQTTPVEVELKCEIVYKGLLRQTDKECHVIFNAVIISSKYDKTPCDDRDD